MVAHTSHYNPFLPPMVFFTLPPLPTLLNIMVFPNVITATLLNWPHLTLPCPYAYNFFATCFLHYCLFHQSYAKSWFVYAIILWKIVQKYTKLYQIKGLWVSFYPWIQPYGSHKLVPQSLPCIFLSYYST